MKNRSKSLLSMIVLLILSLVVAACGDVASTATAVTVPTATTAMVAPTDTTAPAAPTNTTAAVAPTNTTAAMAPTATGGTAMVGDPNLSGTVTFWTAYNTVSPEMETLTTGIIPAFNKLYPNVTVNAQAFPYDDLRQKLLTGIAGGETPDLLRADLIWVPEFAEMGALAKLDEVMPDFATYKDAVYEGPLLTNFYKGNYYGLPLDTNTRVQFYNETLMQEAGITAAPTTFDEFEADCAKIKALGKADTYCFAEGGTGAWNMLPWIWSQGGEMTDDAYTKATGYLNGPASVAAVAKLNQWLKDGLLSPSILGNGIATSDALGKAQSGIIVDGPWMPPIFTAQFPDLKYGLAPYPSGPGGSISVVGGENIVLFGSTKNQEASLAFMRFMLDSESQIALGKVGQMPVLKSLTGSAELPAHYAVFQKQLETTKPRTPNPAWPKIDEAFSNAVLSVLRGEKEPQAALDEAAATIDGLLAGN